MKICFCAFVIWRTKNYNCKYLLLYRKFILIIRFNVLINSTWLLMLVSINFQQSKLSWVLTRPLNLLGIISVTWVLSSALVFYLPARFPSGNFSIYDASHYLQDVQVCYHAYFFQAYKRIGVKFFLKEKLMINCVWDMWLHFHSDLGSWEWLLMWLSAKDTRSRLL